MPGKSGARKNRREGSSEGVVATGGHHSPWAAAAQLRVLPPLPASRAMPPSKIILHYLPQIGKGDVHRELPVPWLFAAPLPAQHRAGAGSGSGQGWMSSALRGAEILLRWGGTTARAGGTGAAGFVQIPPCHSGSAFAPVFAFPKGTALPPTPYAFATRKGQRKRNACGTGGAPFLSWGSTPGQDQRPDFCKSPFCRGRSCVGGFTSVSA